VTFGRALCLPFLKGGCDVANLNKCMFIGRLTRDVEVRTFSNGGKVAKLGLAVNNRKKNQASGQWEDEPVFLDVEVFNRGENGRMADLAEQYLGKGKQVYVEGHLRTDSWEKDGQKRSKLVVVCDNFQFLEPKADGGSNGHPVAARQASRPSNAGQLDDDGADNTPDDNIPF
jgi:single-strand DNA-binding protein